MDANGRIWTPATAYDRQQTRNRRLHLSDCGCIVEGGAEHVLPKVSG